jgi:orotate phosphoribosyltransferase
MSPEEALSILTEHQAVLKDTHVVYTSGRHGSAYVNKDAIYPDTLAVSALCQGIAEHFAAAAVQVVAAPAVGGVILSQWTAFHLTRLDDPCLAVYAEKADGGFLFRRGYDRLLRGKRVLVVEDVITTGGSLRAVIDAVRQCGAAVIGAGVLCNRGQLTADQVGGPPELYALTEIQLESWEEAECPLCRRAVPVNTAVGKGKEFLKRHGANG